MDLLELFTLRAPFSVALKTGKNPKFGDFARPYGGAFNAVLEVGWAKEDAKLESLFSQLIKTIDHKHLGMDATDLEVSTPESLVEFCRQYFTKLGFPPKSVVLTRGEDKLYRWDA